MEENKAPQENKELNQTVENKPAESPKLGDKKTPEETQKESFFSKLLKIGKKKKDNPESKPEKKSNDGKTKGSKTPILPLVLFVAAGLGTTAFFYVKVFAPRKESPKVSSFNAQTTLNAKPVRPVLKKPELQNHGNRATVKPHLKRQPKTVSAWEKRAVKTTKTVQTVKTAGKKPAKPQTAKTQETAKVQSVRATEVKTTTVRPKPNPESKPSTQPTREVVRKSVNSKSELAFKTPTTGSKQKPEVFPSVKQFPNFEAFQEFYVKRLMELIAQKKKELEEIEKQKDKIAQEIAQLQSQVQQIMIVPKTLEAKKEKKEKKEEKPKVNLVPITVFGVVCKGECKAYTSLGVVKAGDVLSTGEKVLKVTPHLIKTDYRTLEF